MQIILGSQSTRRKELLGLLDIPFRCETRDTEEKYPHTLKGEEIPLFLSKLKADAFAIEDADTLLITADTIVWSEGKVYGKPKDEEDACKMLRELSGKTHQVITGVCLTTAKRQKQFAVTTDVTFAKLTDEQIKYYVDTYKPLDKAGAYGIQEWIGAVGIESIHGSYYNVVGLPVQRLSQELNEFIQK